MKTKLSEDAVLLYCWWEKSHPSECKFGEHWLNAGEDALISIEQRVKNSLGVRKDLFDCGDIVIQEIWNASDYARQQNRFYKNSRMDDLVRKSVCAIDSYQYETHSVSASELTSLVNEHLKSVTI